MGLNRPRATRYPPWILAVVAALIVTAVPSLRPPTTQLLEVSFAGPTAPPLSAGHARRLAGISAEAAALTGSLALVDPGLRPARALEAAGRIRELAHEVEAVSDGADLAKVLSDLSGAMERYAGGDPAAVPHIQELSARNAQLRATYNLYSGGE